MNILITGGASGLGKAITTGLASTDSNTVYLTYSRSEAQARELETAFKNITAIPCDYSDAASVQALADQIPDLDLDVLIHNAYQGAFIKNHFQKITPDDFQEDFRINILPVIQLTQVALKGFRKKKQGRIITVLTAALHNLPPTGTAVYVANKAYLEKLTKVWAAENAKYNITSNSVSPAFMETSLTSSLDERLVDAMKDSHPLKRFLTVEEVAASVQYLTTASPHINGVDILLNAATTIR